MNRSKVSFEQVDVRKMPGFPTGGFCVERLSPDVNIVYGPNGSGKTTLCRAMYALLQPDAQDISRYALFGHLSVGQQKFAVEIDHDRVDIQLAGQVAELPPLAPPDIQDRFVLALQDLIGAEDGSEFAEQILRESAGGYDLNSIADSLDLRDAPRRQITLSRELNAAREKVKQARKAQEELATQQRSLDGLRRQRDEARDAAERLALVQQALAVQTAQHQLEVARQAVSQFPKELERLSGSESEQLRRLRQAVTECTAEQQSVRQRAEEAQRRIEKLSLPATGLDEEDVRVLTRQCQQLDALAGDLARHRQDLAKAESKRVAALSRCKADGDNLSVEALSDVEMGELFEFMRRAEQTRLSREAARQLEVWLGQPDDPEDAEAIARGLQLLSDWRATGENLPGRNLTRKLPIGLSCGGLVLSLLLAVSVDISWLLASVVAALILGWQLWPKPRDDRRRRLQLEFNALPIDELSDWNDASVMERWWELQRRLATAKLEQEKASRWGGMQAKAAELAGREEKLASERERWIDRLNVERSALDTEMYLLAQNLSDVHQATDACRSTQAAIDAAQQLADEVLASINQRLGKYDLDEVADANAAAVAAESLDRTRESYRKDSEVISQCEASLAGVERRLATAMRDAEQFFKNLGLENDDDVKLQRWLQERPQFVEAQTTLQRCQLAYDLALAEAGDATDLISLQREHLLREQAQAEQLAASADSLEQQIREIEIRVEQAKEKTDLAEALATQQQVADRFRDQRNLEAEAMVGDALLKYLKQIEAKAERSALFERASHLFVAITHGRYELTVGDGDPPEFRAVDTARQIGLSMDELSSGTRLQLLLAVRVAFVEQQETDWRLPLIFDETLANSDERRAELIIESAIRLCQQGRQIFYLTAQHDEVGKWQSLLKQYDDVTLRLIDLAAVRGFSATERVMPLPIERPATQQIPPPQGLDWLEYGRSMEIPAIDRFQPIAGIHLWYLVEDVDALYRLLSNGINRWGQLQTLVEQREVDWLQPDSTVYRRAVASAAVIETALECWRVGRGKPVDRETLQRSKCVSDTFIDRVSEVSREVQGDSRKLIAAMKDGQITRFPKRKRHELEEFLEAEGFLDPHEPRTSPQILEQVNVRAFADREAGLIDQPRIEQLVEMVTAPAELSSTSTSFVPK